jgi:uncharacterized protein (TIGR03437 family)
VTSAAGPALATIAPGELISITGVGLGPEAGVASTPDAAGLLPTMLAEAEVLFDGVPAPLLYVQAGQITAQVPYAAAGQTTTYLEVRYRKEVRGFAALPVSEAAPALFPNPQNSDGTVVTPGNPAARGSVITLFATGTGLWEGLNVSGSTASAGARPALRVRVQIAGVNAELLSVANAADQPGVLRVDARVPAGFVPPGEAAIEFSVGTFTAPALTIWLE